MHVEKSWFEPDTPRNTRVQRFGHSAKPARAIIEAHVTAAGMTGLVNESAVPYGYRPALLQCSLSSDALPASSDTWDKLTFFISDQI